MKIVTSPQRETIAKAAVFLVLVGLCAAARLVPHPPNFTPVAAVALFAGTFFRRRWVACAVPVLAVMASDALIGVYTAVVMTAVYAGHLFPTLLGMGFSRKVTAWRVGAGAVAAAVVFFLTTNFAVWYSGVLYERTAAGLLACYTSALPFFQHTLLGNLFWCTVIFGGYAFVGRWAAHLQDRELRPAPVKIR